MGLDSTQVTERAHRLRSRRWFVLVVALGSLLMAWTLPGATQALAQTEYAQLDGDTVYETSLRISRAGFDPGVPAAVIAGGEDALAAAPAAVLAAAYGGPLLLTPSGTLDPSVSEELRRLSPEWIFVVGREPSVAAAVAGIFTELGTAGRVVMLCGEDDAETALLIARQVGERTAGVPGVVLLSQEYSMSDVGAVVATAAFAAAKSWPLIYAPASGPLPEATQEILRELAPSTVVEVQTTAEVEPGVETVVLQGKDRYEVAARLAEYSAGVGLSYSHTVVLCGTDGFSGHGLAVGPYLARVQGIAVLSAAEEVPADTVRLLVGQSDKVGVIEFCGPQERGRERTLWLVDNTGLPADFEDLTLKLRSRGEAVVWLENRLAELSYWPGPVDGVFDKQTRQALIAFEKWEGLARDGVVGKAVWWRLLSSGRPTPRYAEQGRWVEVDKERQVLLYCVDGEVEKTIAVSTGSSRVGITTPTGTFQITRENTRERLRYKPLYLVNHGYLAIHGYTNVPTYAASHGCVRMTWADMDEFHGLVPVGTTVHIY